MPDMTTTGQEVLAEMNTPAEGQPAAKPETPKVSKKNKQLYQEIQDSKNYKRKLTPNWDLSVDFRRGKPFSSQTDEDRIAVSLDWSLTKAKQASLYSQTPQIRINHAPETTEVPWLPQFERKVNDTLATAGIESAMDEALPDCINAAGFGAIIVSHEAITETVDVPLFEGSEEMTQVPRTLDHRYTIRRISPADFLWPIDFNGSDFNEAPWVGRSGRISWAEAVRRFNLTEDDKAEMLGSDDRTFLDILSHDLDKDRLSKNEKVGFDEIFYKESDYDEGVKSFAKIHHLVFINGKEAPVVDVPWEGQKDAEGGLIGATKFPLQILTLTYITDEAIPPSDSAVGRPQVEEINKGRGQVVQQRQLSLPMRWVDFNRIDMSVLQGMMRGAWQPVIPVQGDGERILGEVARATFPQEDFAFMEIAKNDLNEAWSVGTNQTGTGKGVETAAEANSIQDNYQTRIGRERAKVSKMFCNIAEVLAGLIALYEEPGTFGEEFDPKVSRTLAYSIVADSTVLVTAQTRLQQLMQFVNFTAKSGWTNIEPVLKEIATLSGLDPNVVIRPPQPPPPPTPTISLRISGAEDMINPLVLGLLMKSGQAPSSEDVQKATQLIQEALTAPPPLAPPGAPGMPGQPPGPGMPGPEGQGPQGPPPQGPPPPVVPPAPPPPPVGEAHPDWSALERINKRTDHGEGGIN